MAFWEVGNGNSDKPSSGGWSRRVYDYDYYDYYYYYYYIIIIIIIIIIKFLSKQEA